ncbi:MAG: SCO family protein [Solirubrobacteraceae bacterium]
MQPPRPTPSLELIDDHGRPTSLSAFRGRWLVLAPAMTLCRETCPLTTGTLMELTDALQRDGLAGRGAVAEVTVDPWRDTPARLRVYRRLTGVNFRLLTGTPAQISRIWRYFGVYYRRVPQGSPPDIDWMTHRPEKFDVQHTDGVFILDPSGRERVADEGMAQPASALVGGLRRLLDPEGRRDLAHPQFPWTAVEVLDALDRLMGRPVLRNASQPHATELASEGDAPAAAAALQSRGRLARNPVALDGLRAQAGQLLGGPGALAARLRSLRGEPVVLNAWASWCPPCRAEFPIFAADSRDYGNEVAFLGVDTDDTPGAARSFLAGERVDYPSYQATTGSLDGLAPVQGTPTTIFIDAAGRVIYTHPGPYESRQALEGDLDHYSLGD